MPVKTCTTLFNCGFLILVRAVLLRDLIGTYVDKCQPAVFTPFSMLMRGVFKYIFFLLVMDMQD